MNKKQKDENMQVNPADGKPFVICRCHVCNKEITDEKDKCDMYGEVVCQQCIDDEMYNMLYNNGCR